VRRAGLAFAPAAAYALVIFLLSARPDPLPFLPPGIWAYDKVLHALEYALLAGLVAPALRLAGLRPAAAVVVAVVIASAYGATDEFHQSFVPGRSADVLDWVADTVGSIVGAVVGVLALRRPGRAG
jgi:VanZ family protein